MASGNVLGALEEVTRGWIYTTSAFRGSLYQYITTPKWLNLEGLVHHTYAFVYSIMKCQQWVYLLQTRHHYIFYDPCYTKHVFCAKLRTVQLHKQILSNLAKPLLHAMVNLDLQGLIGQHENQYAPSSNANSAHHENYNATTSTNVE